MTIAAYGTRRFFDPASPWRYRAEARLGGARGRLDGARSRLAAGWADLERYLPGAVAYRYSRFDDSDPLAYDRREAIHETADDRPGIHLAALAERTGMPFSSLGHHARVLEREGLVTTEKHGGRRRVYPVDVEQPALRAALAEGATAGILDALRTSGPVRVAELARAVERDPSTVSHHLGRLAEDGLVERERDGRAVTVRLADRVRAALRPWATGPAVTDN